MLEAQEKLLGRFYQEYRVVIISLIVSLLLTVTILLFYIIKFKKLKFEVKIVILIALIFFVALTISCIIIFSLYCKDYKYLKSNFPIEISATVLEINPDIDLKPLIINDETNAEIKLKVTDYWNRLDANKKYKFLYLPNTKIAEIIEPIG